MTGLFLFLLAGGIVAGSADRPARNVHGSRSPVLGRNGMVATSQPLASAAALAVLQRGGNAVDAALAAAAVLWVVEPMMTGPGGDLFAMLWDAPKQQLRGLNASGYSPAGAGAEFFRRKGLARVPSQGMFSVTVPGAVDGWFTLLRSHGALKAADLLAPAIEYAERGFPVSEIIAGQWERFSAGKDDPDFRSTYLVEDGAGRRPPRQGEIFRNPRLAATLRLLAANGPEGFYGGAVARKIVEKAGQAGWPMTPDDLAHQRGASQWVQPISASYRGYQLYELPPNGQGLAALEMLNILDGFDLKKMGHNSADYIHLQVEAKKLAFADRDAYVADPDRFPAPLERLLSKEHAAEMRARIDMKRAGGLVSDQPGPDDTVYLTVVDRERNAVSLIHSLASAFGSGVVAGDTGVLLQNRGLGFTLAEGHPNRFEPRKRPLHTIIPAMVFRDGRPVLTFGVMGGTMQPQGHVQAFLNMVEFGMNVQEAGDAPRFRHEAGGLALESGISAGAWKNLAARGHKIVSAIDAFGGYQAVWIDWERGVLAGGSDPRKDGCAMGW